uniref:Uncharacterized protein n=1 Tax=Opuntia streptacantha TaxID=393608 RepID=A0A7C9APC0_OPUST
MARSPIQVMAHLDGFPFLYMEIHILLAPERQLLPEAMPHLSRLTSAAISPLLRSKPPPKTLMILLYLELEVLVKSTGERSMGGLSKSQSSVGTQPLNKVCTSSKRKLRCFQSSVTATLSLCLVIVKRMEK